MTMPPGIGYGLSPQTLMALQQQPGLLAPPAQPKTGLLAQIGQGLGTLFGGKADPMLSAAQNKQARDAALMQAGLAMLAASGPSPVRQSLGQIVAQGAMAGQQAGTASRAGLVQEAAKAQGAEAMGRAFGDGQVGLPQLHAAFAEAVRSGNAEAAKSIATVIQSVESAQAQTADTGAYNSAAVGINPETGKPEQYLLDRRTGTVKWLGVAPVQATGGSTGRLQAPRAYVDPETGQTKFGSFNPATGEFVEVEGALPVSGAGSEGERKAAAFAAFIPRHIAFVDGLLGAPGRVEQALSDRGLREFNSAEQQQLQIAGNAMAEAWLRMTTGAAYNENELRNAYSLFVPQPGDRKETLEMKKQNRQALISMLQTHSGRAGALTAGPRSGFELGGGPPGRVVP